MKLASHESTTAQMGALYPFLSSRSLPASTVVGRDVFGGLFVHDPFELYANGAITNPNMVVLGQIGRGKSAFVKSYLLRHAALGRRVVVLDPKGEYGPLAVALGSKPIKLVPGGQVRINPLELAETSSSPTSGTSEERARQRLGVLAAISGACLTRLLRPAEHAALELALASIATEEPTIADVVAALLEPSTASATSIGTRVRDLQDDGRDIALELRRFVRGELRGMFDGPTSPGVDLNASTVVLDLSALYQSTALGAVLACAAAALDASSNASLARQTLLVVDEAWAVLANVAAARFFQASFKLARARATANIAVVHRLSDLAAVGEKGSVAERLAEGLLGDCETLVCYAQGDSELEGLTGALGVDEGVARTISRLTRGVAYWRVGTRAFLVEHRLSAFERSIVDTDAALLGATS